MKKLIFSIFLLLLTPTLVMSQSKYWGKKLSYTENKTHSMRKVKMITDNNYVAIMGINPDTSNNWNSCFFYLQNNGDTANTHFYIHPTINNADHIIKDIVLTDFGFAMSGFTTGNWEEEYSQTLFQTTNFGGDIIQYKIISEYPSYSVKLIRTVDGGYIMIGAIVPEYPANPPYYSQLYAVKLNSQLDIEWERIY